MFVSNLIHIEDILIRPEIAETKFACDLEKCKGACCTLESEYGAPLLEKEIKKIAGMLSQTKKYLSGESIKIIETDGFFENKDGEFLTRSVENKDCVFVYYENEIAKCSIEKVFFEEGTDFRKPISCHLFPIRVSKFGSDVLRYEKFSDCAPALENGEKNKIKLLDFCKDSLTRLYGKKWYSTLKETIG
ncbi:MAG: DUF3109 family protein [Ignavibacteriaceae bacterium]